MGYFKSMWFCNMRRKDLFPELGFSFSLFVCFFPLNIKLEKMLLGKMNTLAFI